MRKIFTVFEMKLLLAIVSAVVMTGCFSIEKGVISSTGEEHVLVSNYGWYLFHFIPIACGNAEEDALTPWVLFRNDVTMDKIQGRFIDYSNSKKNVTPENLSYTTHESVLFELPGSNIPIPLPYILSYKEIQLSGVLATEKEDSR